HVPTEEAACRAVQEVGMTWGRNWFMNWGMLEPEPGKLSFEKSDEQLLREQELGFNTLALLPPVPAPDWGSLAPDTIPAKVWYRMRYMPQDRSLLNDFIRKSVLHYKDRVKYWEFLNEPVWTEGCLPGKHYNLPGAAYTPADYMELLGPAAAAMKA